MSDGFNNDYDTRPKPNASIQWKGTDVCMDFTCSCGEECHVDGFFMYIVQCPTCNTMWEMPWVLYPRKVEGEPSFHPFLMEKDGD